MRGFRCARLAARVVRRHGVAPVAISAALLLAACSSTTRHRATGPAAPAAEVWLHAQALQPQPLPPPERLPEGVSMRVIRHGSEAPRYVLLDDGLPPPRAKRGGWRQYGVASWYGGEFHGRPTASGEIYDQHAMTAAHPTLPFGARLKVTNLHNGRSCAVRVTDRGPFHGDRILDLSLGAAEELGMTRQGLAWVRIDWLSNASAVTLLE